MTFLLTFYVVSFYSLISSFSLDSCTPGKWAVFKYSGSLPTADCYLKSSPRMCALVKEFILSPFFHTEQGFNRLKWEDPAWLHQSPPISPAPLPAQFPSLPSCSAPCPSLLLPHRALCDVLGFVIMSNMPLSRAQLGCRGWCCCTSGCSWGLCIVQKNMSILPIYFFQGNPFILYFLILRTLPSKASKRIDHFKK